MEDGNNGLLPYLILVVRAPTSNLGIRSLNHNEMTCKNSEIIQPSKLLMVQMNSIDWVVDSENYTQQISSALEEHPVITLALLVTARYNPSPSSSLQ